MFCPFAIWFHRKSKVKVKSHFFGAKCHKKYPNAIWKIWKCQIRMLCPFAMYHHEFEKSCRNAKLTGLMNTGWPGSDSCSFPSLVVLISKKPSIKFGMRVFLFLFFISPLFNKVSWLRTRSHLQLRPGQDKDKQCDKNNNTELHMG